MSGQQTPAEWRDVTETGKWTFPRRCRMDGHKRVCQTLSYDGNGFFTILRGNDKVFVRRSRLTFIPDQKEN